MSTAKASDTDTDTDRDSDDICSDPFEEGCTDSLDDGEGWDGPAATVQIGSTPRSTRTRTSTRTSA